jgi:hypothetical protein
MGRIGMGTWAVALVALVAVAEQATAGFLRGSCLVESSPAALHGAVLGAGSRREARERTEGLGFTWSDPDPRDWRAGGELGVVHLKRGELTWAFETGGPYACLGARELSPLIFGRIYESGHAPSMTDPEGSDPHAEHPNHATGVIGVIGLVGDLENGVANVELQVPFRDNRRPIVFGRAFDLGDLGARAREALVPSGGFVRVISPTSGDGPSAAWAVPSLGRWLGVVLETDDMAATAAWFAANEIPYHEADRRGPALWLDPEETGGLLIEFVPRGWRPRV